MLIDVSVLTEELPSLAKISVDELCDELAMLGFPVEHIKTIGTNKVLDIDVTANRGDVQSHRGLARDLAVKLNAKLSDLPNPIICEGQSILNIEIKNTDVVPIYSAAILKINNLGPQVSPQPILSLLNSMNIGSKNIRSIDISNYILHRYGQPTHIFDADLIDGNIVVRWAKQGESLTTIDLVERQLTDNDLIIADNSGPICLAGLIGGNKTKVSNTTSRILIESAFFEPKIIQSMSYRHNLRTDASNRFSRGVDRSFVVSARNILVHQLLCNNQSELQSTCVIGDIYNLNNKIYLPWILLDQMAGYKIDHHEAFSFLLQLGCNVDKYNEGLIVKAPTWRHDLKIPHDLVEEVLRLKGYDAIPLAIPNIDCMPLCMPKEYIKRRNLTSRLANLGFFQVINTGFISPKDSEIEKDNINKFELVKLDNPLGEEHSVMRSTLINDLSRIAKINLERGIKEVKFFEIAPVFHGTDNKIVECWMLGLIWCGKTGGDDPLTYIRDISLAEGRSFLIGILKSIGITDMSINNFNNWQVLDIKNSINQRIGWQFEVPIVDIADLNQYIIPKFVAFSRFPIIERDISIIVNLSQSFDILKKTIVANMNDIKAPLKDLKCINVFKDKSLLHQKQSWLLRLYFQSHIKNLTKEEIDEYMRLVVTAVKDFGAELRG